MAAERAPGAQMSAWLVWWTAIRPRTLSMAATPVVLGSALAWAEGATPLWSVFVATLMCALLIQMGTNLHNDVADFERGADRPDRIGPLRVTAAGWATPRSVHRAAKLCFGLALLLGLGLVWQGGWPILAIGVTSLIAGWAYSGGKHPISHSALGEVFVLVFFGLLAVAGSHWLQSDEFSLAAWLGGLEPMYLWHHRLGIWAYLLRRCCWSTTTVIAMPTCATAAKRWPHGWVTRARAVLTR